MLTMNKIKSILRQTNRHVRLDQFLDEKKYILCSIVLIGLFIVFMLNSFAALEPVSSITVKSTTLDYTKNEEGSWQYTKTAKWISKGKASINIKLETIEKPRAEYTDVILVLDTSGSMVKDKIEQLQKDVNELINDTIPKGNKISLITFNDTATIVNDFTDDASLLQESINNLTVSGETNYYQALIKVDDVLSTYNKESNRDCVVLFLTDGLPTTDTPNEVGEYKLLKEKYDYLSINGIQYELGDKVLDGIKNITDIQFIASKKTLNKFLYKASISPASYDNFVLTDYVDTDNFNLKNISNISTTFGNASIEDNQVIWNLDNFKTGLDAELTIDINLNDDLIGVGGVYPTHTKTDVSYKIGTTSVTETTDKTTILKDNYAVTYEANTPTGCVVSGLPSSKVYSVFDTVRLDDSVPACIGYQFQEWKIVTDDIEKVGNNRFIMPESNVTIKAIWKNASINKTMSGIVSEAQTLYGLMADNSNGTDVNIDFSKSATDNSGIYTRSGTENDQYPVHYYRGNIDNNNVIFAGFCWKMVRTTSTGGVKLLYNGVASVYSEGIPILQDQYVNVSNDATYPYTYDTATNKWTSTNKTDSKTGTLSFSVSEPGTYILSYSVSSEKNYDKAYFYKDNVELKVDSGTSSSTVSLGELTSTNVITVKYSKDGSGSSGSDSVVFSVDKSTGNIIRNCNNSGNDSQVGFSRFDSVLNLPGYMYGTGYPLGKHIPTTSVSILENKYTSSSSNYYYSDFVTYANGSYTLTDAEQKTWSDNYNELTGYYTCRSDETTCTTVYYIAGATSSYQYVLSLSDGATDATLQTITLGKSVIDNGDGTYTLEEPMIIKKKDWYSTYGTYNEYYVCDDLTSTTCDVSKVTLTSNTRMLYDTTLNYIYGNDVSWNGTNYVLNDTYKSTELWSKDKATLAKKYHYTCLNTTGVCTEVYYIYDFAYNSSIDYLILSDGDNIEDAKEKMFENNTSSEVKLNVDNWYQSNMTAYTHKLEDTIWCVDRTLYSGSLVGKDIDAGTGSSYFGAYNRVYNTYNPSVTCSNKKRDGFTVSTDSGGNGALTYPVGLLTVDEALLAGANYSPNYLYSGNDMWLLSPASYYGQVSNFRTSGGRLASGPRADRFDTRPAVSLIKGTKYTDGDGTVDNPFVIGDE